MSRHVLSLAAGLSLVVGPRLPDRGLWSIHLEDADALYPLSTHPSRAAALLAAEDVATCCAAALAVAAGCSHRAVRP